MEALVALSEGSPGVRSVGVGEYINEFFDVIDDDVPWHWRELSCLTPVEVEALNQVSKSFDSGMPGGADSDGGDCGRGGQATALTPWTLPG
jgi:hypothetical protein